MTHHRLLTLCLNIIKTLMQTVGHIKMLLIFHIFRCDFTYTIFIEWVRIFYYVGSTNTNTQSCEQNQISIFWSKDPYT